MTLAFSVRVRISHFGSGTAQVPIAIFLYFPTLLRLYEIVR